MDLADLQDQEVGDGTTSVVIFASELLKRGNDLVRQKIHPTSILSGFRMAMREVRRGGGRECCWGVAADSSELQLTVNSIPTTTTPPTLPQLLQPHLQACKYIEENLAIETSTLGEETLLNAARTAMSSKIVGADADFFGRIVVDAVTSVRTADEGRVRYPVSAINVLKAHGKGLRESALLDGYALNLGRAAQGMPRRITNARVACLDMNLQKARMHMGVQVLVTDPAELERIRARESEITRERIRKVLDAGANVVLTAKGIDDESLKCFVEAGALACRRVPKEDLRRVARATGATIVSTLADMEGAETFDAANLGSADEVVEEAVSGSDVVMVRRPKNTRAVTVLLRGANDYLLDEVDRSLHDAFCIVKRVLESGRVVPGGGAVEAALNVYLENFATTLASREQLAIAEFADALLVIPKTLAVNAAQDATELVARLRAYHTAAQTKADKRALARSGLDLLQGTVRDNVEAGVLEPALSKVKIIQFATEAAITILRIDDLIRLAPEPEDGEE